MLADDFDSHAAGGAGDDSEGGLFGGGIEVLHFGFDDLEDLFASNLADLFFVGFFGTNRDSGSLLEQNRSGRGFSNETERLVLKDSDNDRDNHAGLVFGPGVEFLAERHDVDAVLTEGGADGRGGIRLTGGNLEFNRACNLLSHISKVSSVSRSAFFNLPVFEFDGGIASENIDRNFELAPFRFDFLDHTAEIEKGSVVNLDGLADVEADLWFFVLFRS